MPCKNPLHQRFAEEFVVDLLPQEAYRRVYPNASPAAASANANKLRRRPDVKAEINRLLAEVAARSQLSADNALKEVHAIAFDTVRNKNELRLRALEILLKYLKGDGDRPPVQGPTTVTVDVAAIAKYTDEELEKGLKNVDRMLALLSGKGEATP
jgi:hypothetical protein